MRSFLPIFKKTIFLPFLLISLFSCSNEDGKVTTGEYYDDKMMAASSFDNVTIRGKYVSSDGKEWSLLLENDSDKYHFQRVIYNVVDASNSLSYDYLRDVYFCQIPYSDAKGYHSLWVYYIYEGKKKNLSSGDYSFSISDPSQNLAYTLCGSLTFSNLSSADGKDWLGMLGKAKYDLMSKQYVCQEKENATSSNNATATTTYSYGFSESNLYSMFFSNSTLTAGVALTSELSYYFTDYGSTYVGISSKMSGQNQSVANSLLASSSSTSSSAFLSPPLATL